MGQYHIPVNLTKREFVDPHRLGAGLKLWEQLAAHPGTGAALIILCAALPENRGGGDFDVTKNWHGPERKFPEHNCTPAPMPKTYAKIARSTIGRWAGDRIAIVGDYAERGDLPAKDNADLIYELCCSKQELKAQIAHLRNNGRAKAASRLEKLTPFTDVSHLVAAVIEHELNGKFTGEGWRDFERSRT